MSYARMGMLLACLVSPVLAQESAGGPTNEKAQKTYKEAIAYVHQHRTYEAFGSFKKADKQDGGHCLACQEQIINYAIGLRDWNSAENAASEMIANAASDKALAISHFQLGLVLMKKGIDKHKDESFARAHHELTKALAAAANFPGAIFIDGKVLACLKRDDEAKVRFQQFAAMKPADNPDRQRALRYISQPDLARARMAPPFAVTTTDGKHVVLDDLKGNVVLVDFWATWCAPCRAAIPHIREIAKKFDGQPLMVLSVSVDTDEQKWKNFVANNEMTWPQYWDGGFNGATARLFSVDAIPHTFTIDADGVLQDEHIGDASIEGKLKKLVAQALSRQSQALETPPQ